MEGTRLARVMIKDTPWKDRRAKGEVTPHEII